MAIHATSLVVLVTMAQLIKHFSNKPKSCAFMQTVEIPLDFSNYQLEAAKRLYSEKHPLGKEKEQLSRLRTEIGRSEKGERLLEYTITNSSSLICSPETVALRVGSSSSSSGAITAAAGGTSAGAGALTTGPSGTSRVPSATSSKPPAIATQQQLQRGLTLNTRAAAAGGAGGVGGSPNVLKLSFRPTGTGVYPARLLLTSPWDVRVVDVEIVAQCMGQTALLELECAARQSVSMGV